MKLKIWELALIFAVIISVLCGFTLNEENKALSEKLVRLHVVANSDSDEDQKLKLKIRDAVLGELETLLDGVENKEKAEVIIKDNIEILNETAENTAAWYGYSYDVRTSLTEENFPTREYDSFSLPAGRYTSLRIIIGDGAGRNWWCVVFPPVCSAEAIVPGTQETITLTDDEIALITEENTGYMIKFKAIEILESIKSWIIG